MIWSANCQIAPSALALCQESFPNDDSRLTDCLARPSPCQHHYHKDLSLNRGQESTLRRFPCALGVQGNTTWHSVLTEYLLCQNDSGGCECVRCGHLWLDLRPLEGRIWTHSWLSCLSRTHEKLPVYRTQRRHDPESEQSERNRRIKQSLPVN